MNILSGHWATWEPVGDRSSATIGVLDGVHRGHRALIRALDPTMTRTVMTFDPHPLEVLKPGSHPRLITTIDERIELLETHGVDQVAILDLADIKDLAPEAFVEDVLVGSLGIGDLVVGEDFRFGKDRSGNVDILRAGGAKHGFRVDVIDLVADEQGSVSSSRIRSMIEAGQVAQAAAALGSRYSITAEVVEGDKRGRRIGYPTANLMPPPRKVIPAVGIYAALVVVDGRIHQSAVNVGVRPTFGGGALVIEAYLLDFEGDLYGEDLEIEFVDYIRPELKFADVDELVDTMARDVERARELLAAVI
jgi:riboflavin kinase/FMN adenylyltransferase